jgi:hypothetical protein
MSTPNLFAYDPSGRVFVVVDGKEVLVHGGADEAPRWRKSVDAELVGLGAGGDAVITLERSGQLTFWSSDDGVALETIAAGEAPLALAVTRNGSACAVVFADGITVVTRGAAPQRIAATAATAAAWSRDGARLAIGEASGAVRIVSAAGDAVGSTRIEEPVSSLCYSPAGSWIATGGAGLFRVDEAGASVAPITRVSGYSPDCVCASTDGSMLAVRLSDALMLALALPSRDTAVQLRYLDRQIAGVAFGPDRLLGVGLVGGDGNIVDVTEQQLRRSDTFPGRTHNRWAVSTTINPEVLPPAPPRSAALRPAAPASTPSAGSRSSSSSSPGGLPLLGWLGILGALIAFAVALSMCR